MAEQEQSSGDRTEAATPKRLERAREAGQVPVSREVATFASLLAVTTVLAAGRSDAFRESFGQIAALFLHVGTLRAGDGGLASWFAGRIVRAAWAPLAAAALAGAGAVLLQTQLLLHFGAVAPKMSRVSPLAGLKRLFGTAGLVEIVRAVVKLAALGTALYMLLRRDIVRLAVLPLEPPRDLPAAMLSPSLHVLYVAVGTQAVIAGADLLWVRFKNARDLRMTKQDLRDEFKETEGSPQMKARLRRIRWSRARKRMMARVPTATVVVTNPTHYAVALVYDRATNSAPKVVAKGQDHIAAKIRQIAQEASVPIVSNPPLARALYQLELDTEIPAEHFRAVAQIIAYIWRLRRERAGGAPPQ
jgi:flagellar biosynthetic protein FlhB